MRKKITALVLTASLLIATGIFMHGQAAPSQPSSPQYVAQNYQAAPPAPERPTQLTRRQQRSYYRETQPRRHHGITKKEVLILGAVAGTPMAIGAIAGGGEGLAIGSIVGGWSAIAGHYIWHHVH